MKYPVVCAFWSTFVVDYIFFPATSYGLENFRVYFFCLFVFVLEIQHISFLSRLLEFWCYFYKHFNSDPIFIYIGIYLLTFQTLEFYYLCKHWNSDLILSHMGFLALCFKTLKSWSYPSKHWNSGSFLYKDWNSDLILPTLKFWPLFHTHWFSDLFFFFFFKQLEFWPYL